jgi:hypothetical protein
MTLTVEQTTQLQACLDEHNALQRDYPRVCAAAWDVLRIMAQGDPLALQDATTHLRLVLRRVNAQCACDPPGSAGEHCTGHCCPS